MPPSLACVVGREEAVAVAVACQIVAPIVFLAVGWLSPAGAGW